MRQMIFLLDSYIVLQCKAKGFLGRLNDLIQVRCDHAYGQRCLQYSTASRVESRRVEFPARM